MPKLDIDLDLLADMCRDHEAATARFLEAKEEMETSAATLLSMFEAEPSLAAGSQVETRDEHNGDLIRAKLQESFVVERRPDAPQKSLDRVFERRTTSYVKIERVPALKSRIAGAPRKGKSRS